MHDPIRMKIADGRQRSLDNLDSIRLIVRTFLTDPIKELAAESEIRDEID